MRFALCCSALLCSLLAAPLAGAVVRLPEQRLAEHLQLKFGLAPMLPRWLLPADADPQRALSQYVHKGVVEHQSCTLISVRPGPDVPMFAYLDDRRAHRVQVRVRCPLWALVGLYKTFEDGLPLLEVVDQQLYRNPASTAQTPVVDARFELQGFSAVASGP